MTIVLALFASLFIGVSDFLGGIVSRTRSPLETSLVVFLAALMTLVPIAVLLGASDLTAHDLGLGAVSGLTTSVAYVGFFAAIGHGRISIVAPISAAVTALLPAIAGIAEGNTLSTIARYGILCALLAIPLVAYETDDGEANDDWSTRRQVLVSILCGVGFGFYFICIGHTHRSSGLWPTVATLVVGIAIIAPLAARGGVMPSLASLSRLAVAGGVALGVADAAPHDRAAARAADRRLGARQPLPARHDRARRDAPRRASPALACGGNPARGRRRGDDRGRAISPAGEQAQ